VLGLIANALIRPVAERWFMSDQEVEALQQASGHVQTGSYGIGTGQFDLKAALAWALVGVPLLWGVWITLSKAFVLFS
jgi:hypothetical protein